MYSTKGLCNHDSDYFISYFIQLAHIFGKNNKKISGIEPNDIIKIKMTTDITSMLSLNYRDKNRAKGALSI